jgi:hypothetical protein
MNLRFTNYDLRLALQNGRRREPIQGINAENGKAPQGRQKFSIVPAGLDFIRSVFPPLKRRAIFGCHFVTSR